MKSIVQEASSVARAIEQGWQKAGCPTHFSVKILELPQVRFFFFTSRSAKVALYFGDEPLAAQDKSAFNKPKYTRESREPRKRREEAQQPTPQRVQPEAQAPQRELRQPSVRVQPTEETQGTREARQQKRFEPNWNDDIIGSARQWLSNALKAMDRSDVTFTIQPQHYHLRIVLSRQLLDTSDREKQLLASFSALIMETLRKEFKTGFRGHKIVLTHA